LIEHTKTQYEKINTENQKKEFFSVMNDGKVKVYSREYVVWARVQKFMHRNQYSIRREEREVELNVLERRLTGFRVNVCSWEHFMRLMDANRDGLMKVLSVNFDYIIYGNRRDCWRSRRLEDVDRFYAELVSTYNKATIPRTKHVRAVGIKKDMMNLLGATYALPNIYVEIGSGDESLSNWERFVEFCIEEVNCGLKEWLGKQEETRRFNSNDKKTQQQTARELLASAVQKGMQLWLDTIHWKPISTLERGAKSAGMDPEAYLSSHGCGCKNDCGDSVVRFFIRPDLFAAKRATQRMTMGRYHKGSTPFVSQYPERVNHVDAKKC